MTVVSVCSAIN